MKPDIPDLLKHLKFSLLEYAKQEVGWGSVSFLNCTSISYFSILGLYKIQRKIGKAKYYKLDFPVAFNETYVL